MISLIVIAVSLVALIPTATADGVEILYVETGETTMLGQLQMNHYKTAIYSPVEQAAVITMYVQDETLTPVGVFIFKTTLLAGTTPIEYSFSVPNECAYNSMAHKMVCSADFAKTVYVNVFTDFKFTQPITAEFMVMA